MRRLVTLALVWLAVSGATPLPLKPPPADLTQLVPWAAVLLDKPSIELPRLPVPAQPLEPAVVSPAPLVLPAGPKPFAPVPPARALPCVGAWLRIASESLECGRSRLVKGEYDEAARALEHAVQTTDRDVLLEARYWHGEVLYLVGDYPRADWAFRQVVQDAGRSEFGYWALHGSGWTALRLGDAVRAEESFRKLLSAAHPVPLDVWGRHGLGLALYALGRWADAEKIWADLGAPNRRLPVALSRDLAFWHGDTLGRVGQADRATEKLTGFTLRGAHPLVPLALVRLGWWQLGAGRPADAAAAFRTFLTGPAPTVGDVALEREWAQAGLALALIATGDAAGARTALAALDTRRSALAVPIRMRLAARAIDNGQPAEALGAVQELLSGSLSGPVRAWVLVIKGEAHRLEGNRDEARTQFDLARGLQPGSETGRYATLRMAQMNFELREFVQAMLDVAPLLGASAGPDLRVAALLLEGEAAYQASDFAKAANAYRRALVEFPSQAQAPVTKMALAWAALRQGQRDAALRQFLDFAREHPADPRAVDALLLASELALDAGQLDRARELLDRIVTAHAANPRAEIARLNRALLRVRVGELAAERELTEWIARAPSPALIGRAWAALGAARLAAGRPAEAAQAYRRARDEGLTEIGKLGMGMAALAQDRLDDAARDLTEARDTGTSAITAAAEYGLAVVAYYRGRHAEFKPAAVAALQAMPRGPRAARLLYVLVGIAVEERDWPAALSYARRLVTEYPQDDAADDALERVGAGAAAASVWPPAWEAYALLRQQYARSPFVESSRFAYARALQETGRPGEARRVFEEFVTSAPNDPQALEAWLALGRGREAAGDRKGALDAFGRAVQSGANPTTHRESFVTYARALSAERRWNEARLVWERLLAVSDPAAAVDVSVSVGDAWAGQGEHLMAAEYYMTAAYLGPDSPAGRQALLAAGRSFHAARDDEAAAIVYRKLIAQKDLPAELAEQARRALGELRR